MKMKHEFVDYIPDKLEAGILYVSMNYGTVIHLCPCGCKNEVVTPLTPTDWALTFNGENITLFPSVGNWEFSCLSHYWIRKNRVEWAGKWSKKEIKEGKRQDREKKQEQLDNLDHTTVKEKSEEINKPKRWWIIRFLFGE